MHVTFWGTRGSIPTPGRDTVTFGGNTSCVAVTVGSRVFIFDAGSGIRLLGDELVQQPGPLAASIFITHVHWDHIQGFPFFAPCYQETTTLDIYGLPLAHKKIDLLLSSQMEQTYFPVNMSSLRAKIRFHDLDSRGEASQGEGVRVRTQKVNHTTDTVGFRIEAEGRAVVYVPDNELALCSEPERTRYEDVVAFARGADLLIHDAQYTDATYGRYRGWGHSTREEAARLARDAGAKRVALFHHDPRATDDELSAWEEKARAELSRSGARLELACAREGSTIRL
jgi:phosphoribosyl 1,2-cyclic phosphodiesterase